MYRRATTDKFTGGARGIGLAVATGYAEAGAQVRASQGSLTLFHDK